jgi:hypothetical protein
MPTNLRTPDEFLFLVRSSQALLTDDELHQTRTHGMHSQTKRRKRFLLFALFFILLGVLLFVSAKAAVDQTNTLEFCISCHEMKSHNFNEYKDTIHAKTVLGLKQLVLTVMYHMIL